MGWSGCTCTPRAEMNYFLGIILQEKFVSEPPGRARVNFRTFLMGRET